MQKHFNPETKKQINKQTKKQVTKVLINSF